MLKFITIGASLAFAVNQKSDLEKQWTYLNRLYPEPTELQKTLYREAQTFKEIQWQQKSIQDRVSMDTETKKLYGQMYQLPPQRYPEADDDPNPPTILTH